MDQLCWSGSDRDSELYIHSHTPVRSSIITTTVFCPLGLLHQSGQMSKEVTVLPCNSKSGAFSRPGDSGSAVVDGKGRFAGLLVGGAGVTEVFDCTYLTSINFLLKRMLEHGLKANLYPSLG
jgi:hypothetical protein